MNNPTEWYQRLQLYRNVLPRRKAVFSSNKAECYALSVRNAQFSNVSIFPSYLMTSVPFRFFSKLCIQRKAVSGIRHQASVEIPLGLAMPKNTIRVK